MLNVLADVPLLLSWSRRRAELSCWTEPSPMQELPWFWWTLLSQPAEMILVADAAGGAAPMSTYWLEVVGGFEAALRSTLLVMLRSVDRKDCGNVSAPSGQ